MKSTLHILLLDDNLTDRVLVEERLNGEGFLCEFTCTQNEEEFQKALEGRLFELVISGFTLPTYSGMKALALCKQLRPETPFIFVSGTIGEELAIEGLKSGATDHILRDRLDRLGQAVRRALRETDARADRKQVEEQVRIQSSALQAAGNGIILTDLTGRISFANKAFCDMTGYAVEEILGQTPRILNSGKHSAAFFAELWKTILEGRIWNGELTNRRKDGTFFHEEMTITPITGETGKISYFIAVKQDITRRKLLEEQLQQAQKMEAIGQLAGGVAHDFNNLLLVIHGNIELVLRSTNPLDEPSRHCLQQATAASERAANLVRQLLFFSRKQAVQFLPVNLNAVIRNLTKMVNRIIGENISQKCTYADRLPLVNADIGMIEQVLVNLIINARDAMPGGGTLTITTELVNLETSCLKTAPEAQVGNFVLVTVSDTGMGIPQEHLQRIFEPFFTTKEVGKGTGLGLATAYSIVKQHKGWIEVSSAVGKGTIFKLFLPPHIGSSQEGFTRPPDGNISGGHENVLLVEDEPDVRRFLGYILKEAGYQVSEAANGMGALKLWQANPSKFDLLLTDIVMPGGLNGKELAERLKQERSALKVILMSGYSLEIADGISFSKHYLQKPFSIGLLMKSLRDCLDE